MVWVRIAGVTMFLGIALGAFGAHGLKGMLTEEGKQVYQTAVFYHLIHGLAFLGLGWLSTIQPGSALIKYAGICFGFGILLFSGSLYVLAVTGIRKLGIVTPFGGLAFLIGWIFIFLTASR